MSDSYKISMTDLNGPVSFGGGGGDRDGGDDSGHRARKEGHSRRNGRNPRPSSRNNGGLTNNGKAALCAAGIVGSAAISGTGLGAIVGRIAGGALATGICSEVDWSKVR